LVARKGWSERWRGSTSLVRIRRKGAVQVDATQTRSQRTPVETAELAVVQTTVQWCRATACQGWEEDRGACRHRGMVWVGCRPGFIQRVLRVEDPGCDAGPIQVNAMRGDQVTDARIGKVGGTETKELRSQCRGAGIAASQQGLHVRDGEVPTVTRR